jgi:outer membrane protein assembly factor BamA
MEDRFRLGGTGSMRAFERDAVGPKNLTSRVNADWPNGIEPIIDYTLRDNPVRFAPTGGDLRALGSFDLLIPLPLLGLTSWEGYDIALFTDVGNVWLIDEASKEGFESSPNIEFSPLLRLGSGIGFRAITPVGPLQLDLAANPQRLLSSGRRQILLAEDYGEPWLRLHLTLGTLW